MDDKGRSMPQKIIDNTAIATAASAPAWAGALAQLNTVLTTVSLVLGIAFLVWRWRRSASSERAGEEG